MSIECNIEPPTARRLILNLLSVSEDGRLSASEAVKACALFGIASNNARVALARLSASGLIEAAERGSYQLGVNGQALAADIAGWREAEARIRPWDGGWVAAFTGSLPRADRVALRARDRALALLGMRELDSGLFIRPDNLTGGVAAARERLLALGLGDAAPVLLARDFDQAREKQARQLWDAALLTQRYRDSRKKLKAWAARASKLPVEQAARESFLLGDEAIHQLVFDPMLPEPLSQVDERQTFTDAVLQFDRDGHAIWRAFLKGA